MLTSLDEWLTAFVLKVIPTAWQPNHITAARILLIPVVWALYYNVSPFAATAMFASLALTDFVDGRLARGRGIVTASGKLLDIGCDLMLVWSTVTLLWKEHIILSEQNPAVYWSLVIIFAREIIVTAVRLSFEVKAADVRVLKVGKCKTGFFMVGLGVLLTSSVWVYGIAVGTAFLVFAAACSLISGVQYVQQLTILAQGKDE